MKRVLILILSLFAVVAVSTPLDAQVRDHRNGVKDNPRPGSVPQSPRLDRAHGGVIVTGAPRERGHERRRGQSRKRGR